VQSQQPMCIRLNHPEDEQSPFETMSCLVVPFIPKSGNWSQTANWWGARGWTTERIFCDL